jgi:hypothetical protein
MALSWEDRVAGVEATKHVWLARKIPPHLQQLRDILDASSATFGSWPQLLPVSEAMAGCFTRMAPGFLWVGQVERLGWQELHGRSLLVALGFPVRPLGSRLS